MKYYVVNTNKKKDPSGLDESTMLNEEIVSLYFDGYKEKIIPLQEGDMVFLYSNNDGIIGYGTVTGRTYIRPYQGNPSHKGQEYYRRLDNFKRLKKPLSAMEIKTIVGGAIVMARAIFNLSEEYALPILKHIEKHDTHRDAA